jgi:hypothetical protein
MKGKTIHEIDFTPDTFNPKIMEEIPKAAQYTVLDLFQRVPYSEPEPVLAYTGFDYQRMLLKRACHELKTFDPETGYATGEFGQMSYVSHRYAIQLSSDVYKEF